MFIIELAYQITKVQNYNHPQSSTFPGLTTRQVVYKFHQNWMKNKKVLLVSRFPVSVKIVHTVWSVLIPWKYRLVGQYLCLRLREL